MSAFVSLDPSDPMREEWCANCRRHASTHFGLLCDLESTSTTPPSDERKAEEALRIAAHVLTELDGLHGGATGEGVRILARALLAQHDRRAKELAVVEAAREWRRTPGLDDTGSTVAWVRAHRALERAVDALEGT